MTLIFLPAMYAIWFKIRSVKEKEKESCPEAHDS